MKTTVLILGLILSIISFDSCKKKISQTTIPEVNFQLELPNNYSIKKSDYSRGLSHYEFFKKPAEWPSLDSVQFDNDTSILQAEKDCAKDSECLGSILNDPEIKKIITGNSKTEIKNGEKLKILGDHQYYIYPIEPTEDPDYLKQMYVTYVNDIRIVVLAAYYMCGEKPDSEKKAEALISELSFKKNN